MKDAASYVVSLAPGFTVPMGTVVPQGLEAWEPTRYREPCVVCLLPRAFPGHEDAAVEPALSVARLLWAPWGTGNPGGVTHLCLYHLTILRDHLTTLVARARTVPERLAGPQTALKEALKSGVWPPAGDGL